jgi:hypothetical protein
LDATGLFAAPVLRDADGPDDLAEVKVDRPERAVDEPADIFPLADVLPVGRLRLFINSNLLLNSLYRLCAYDPFISLCSPIYH